MSVVVRSPRGCVLDACALIDRAYSRCIRCKDNLKSRVKCCFKRQCFQVPESRSGAAAAAAAAADGGTADMMQKTDKPRKKRKRKHSELNQGEVDSQAFHERIRSVILEGTRSLVDSARPLGHLNGATDAVKEPLPSQSCSLAALCEMAKELPLVDEEQTEHAQLLVAEDGCTSHVDLFSRVTENREDSATAVTLMGEEYVIPPHTAFLLSDFTRIQPLVHYGKKFDLIVMDPPWENKSVKRSRSLKVAPEQKIIVHYLGKTSGSLYIALIPPGEGVISPNKFNLLVSLEEKSRDHLGPLGADNIYSSLPSTQLKRLPVPLLASPSCLVVTWVTNRPSHRRFVRDELYPHWGVEVVAEWFWVKVTTSGQYVFPLDSPHKKPYEVLVLGRYRPPADNSTGSSEVPVEDQRLIVSVPSALHSQKPSLSEVLKRYVGAEARCLELFARSLQPGWTSWGNEVLKFQHTSYFTLTPTDEPGDVPKDEAADEGTVTPGDSSAPRPTSD